MGKKLLLLLCVVCLSGCSFMIKTPEVANYDNFSQIGGGSTRNDVALLLGTPQSQGLHQIYDKQYDAQFYYGFAGKFTLSTAKYDSGTAYITYDNDEPIDLIYFVSKSTGKEISLKKDLSIKELASNLVLGKTNIQYVFDTIGSADYTGKRKNYIKNITNTVAFWDSSKSETNGTLKEKWLLIGYDSSGTVQDVMWVSSYPSEISAFGQVAEQQVKQISKLSFAALFPVRQPTEMSTGTKIDSMQVDALLNTRPENIHDIIAVLGKPTALGVKSFIGDEPMSLSNWSFSKIEMKGSEHNYVPPSASDEEKEAIAKKGKTFMIMKIDQSRLVVGHDESGNIKEILWVRPID